MLIALQNNGYKVTAANRSDATGQRDAHRTAPDTQHRAHAAQLHRVAVGVAQVQSGRRGAELADHHRVVRGGQRDACVQRTGRIVPPEVDLHVALAGAGPQRPGGAVGYLQALDPQRQRRQLGDGIGANSLVFVPVRK